MLKMKSLLVKTVRALCMLALLAGSVEAVYVAPAYSAEVPVADPLLTGTKIAGWVKEAAAWVMNTALMQGINAALLSLNATIVTEFNRLIFTITKATAIKTAAKKAQAKAEEAMTQAFIDSEYEDEELKSYMRTAAKHAPSAASSNLCNAVVLNQASLAGGDFKKSVARAAKTAIETMYRGKGADGNGPQSAADNFNTRCSGRFGSGVDMPAKCVDTTTKGTDGRSIQDADLSFSTIAGGQVLELPEFKSYTVNDVEYNVPVPKNDQQRFWVAGLYYCFNLAGPRPTPPYGDALDTPAGRAAMYQWRVCAARQSQLISPCMDMLAYYTRPNAKMKDRVAEDKKKCKAAARLKIKLPDSYDACEHGISPYQAEELEQGICKSPQFFVTQKLASGKDPKMMDTAVDCLTSWDTWQAQQVERKTAVYTSVPGILELESCWARVDALMK